MAFFGLFGGDSSKDRKRQLQAWDNLQSLFGTSTATAGELKGTGMAAKRQGIGDLSTSQNYWKTLLSGSRPEIEGAVAPEANRMREAADTQKKQAAEMGTGRTGGTAAMNRSIDQGVQQQIDTLIGTIRPQAADKLGQIGVEFANIGAQDISSMLSALGIGESASATLGQQSGQAREFDVQQEGKASEAFTKAMLGVLLG